MYPGRADGNIGVEGGQGGMMGGMMGAPSENNFPVVRLRGLPYQATEEEVVTFLVGILMLDCTECIRTAQLLTAQPCFTLFWNQSTPLVIVYFSSTYFRLFLSSP